LEELSFKVPEIDKEYRVDERYTPVIILTSNSEKNLPEPFLRRCIYFNIEFPNQEELLSIISKKLDSEFYMESDISNTLIPHFLKLRALTLRKKPSTAEFILWVNMLESRRIDISSFSNISIGKWAGEKNLIERKLSPDELVNIS
jgi:MoxR-like ATPase